MSIDDTTDSSRGYLRGKLPPVEPPSELEARVKQSLTDRGLIVSQARRSKILRQAIGIGAVAASFLFTGIFIGRNSESAAAPNGQRYALLLYRGESAPGAESTDRRKEYGEWLESVASNDRSFSGEELEPALATLGPPAASAPLVGFFIVRAKSDAGARDIARTSPHLKHGGTIVLQRIVE